MAGVPERDQVRHLPRNKNFALYRCVLRNGGNLCRESLCL
jgi:hypothetical protein